MDGFRISPIQRHVWALRQAEDRWAYDAQCALQVDGPVDGRRLLDALRTVVARHEILRTAFPRPKSLATPLQVIRECPEVRFEEVSRATVPEDEAALIEELLRRERRRPSEPAEGTPLRATLVRFASRRGALLLTLSALCADGRSWRTIVREMAAAYGPPGSDALGPVSMQYADVAEWQNALLEGEDSQAGRDRWHWAGDRTLPAPTLPFETREGPAGSFQPEAVTVPLSEETARRMAALASDVSAEESSVWLAGWALLLSRLTGASELLLGCEEDGRGFEELRDAVGPCARSLPMRCSLPEGVSFADLTSRLDAMRREQTKWQDYFVPGFSGAASGGPEPHFPLAFTSRKLPEPLDGGDVTWTPLRTSGYSDRFELRLAALEAESSDHLELQYDSGLFSAEHMRLVAEQLSQLLDEASRAPRVPLEDLSGGEEPARPQTAAQPTEDRREETLFVHRRFERDAREEPGEIVLRDESGAVSRGELEERAERIARSLREEGVGPESVVGILAVRSRHTVSAILGVWRAGAAYLPIDPVTPRDRMAFMLADSGARVTVCPEEFADRLAGLPGRVVRLGADSGAVADRENARSRPKAWEAAGNLAYVIYTSGSTGRPKGVAVEHRQLSHYLSAILATLDPAPGSSFALVSSFAADLGNTAIFPPLCGGGVLHVLSEERAADPEALAEYFDRHPIDFLKIVPSHLEALLAVSRPERLLPRRCLILGGEPSSWDLVSRVRRLAPACAILNHYGPTETTVGVTAYRIPSSPAGLRPRTVPVGRPLGTGRLRLLDRRGRPVPLWVPGELHVAGESVSRGYVNRPDATAERFLPDSRSLASGERLYATGDVARVLPDGNIELLGRADGQVKIHGFRVELGEIEGALREHAGLAESVVLLREDDPGVKRLVAYLVPRKGPVAREGLREWLGSRLPEFMVPSAFVLLDRLPRTASGKVDRRALPRPALEREETRADVAPRTRQERALADVWSAVLGVERVGIHENFFHLGGDSILGIQVIARASRAGLRLTPRQIFQHQTVAELALAATRSDTDGAPDSPVTGSVPLTPIQHWFFEQNLVDPHHYNQAILLAAKEPLEPDLLERAVAGLLDHHDALRLRFSRAGAGWTQRYAEREGGRVLSRHDLSALPEAERVDAMRSAARELHSGLDLSNGPLARVAHFELGPDTPGRLLLLVHHLAVDGISWRVLLEDLETAYRQILAGQTLRLPPKTSSFQKWAEELAVFAHSDEIESELDYWGGVAANPAPGLPVDRADGQNTVGSAREVTVSLDAGETRDLLKEVPAAFGTQINEVLVACLLQAFTEWTGAPSLLVDMEGHGREALSGNLDLSRSVGWFTSRFPLFVRSAAAVDFDEAIAAVKEQLRRLPRHGLGFGLLRYLSRESVRRRMEDLPQPLVSFNYLGQFDRMLPEESLFDLAPESLGSQRSPRAARKYLLAIDGKVLGGELRFTWTYGEETFDRAPIERVAGAFRSALQRVIVQARPAGAGSRPVSEFPESGLTQRDLEVLIGQLQGGGKGAA